MLLLIVDALVSDVGLIGVVPDLNMVLVIFHTEDLAVHSGPTQILEVLIVNRCENHCWSMHLTDDRIRCVRYIQMIQLNQIQIERDILHPVSIEHIGSVPAVSLRCWDRTAFRCAGS